jgi:predicted  nucleic acid-binding Zn-ribbon protein
MSRQMDGLELITGGLAAGLAGGLLSGMQRGAAAHRERMLQDREDCEAAAAAADAGVLHATIATLRSRILGAESHISILQDEVGTLRRERDAARRDATVLTAWIRANRKDCRA